MNTPQPSPEAAPEASPDLAPAQDMAVIQVPHADLIAAAQGAQSLLPIIEMITQAAAKATADIEAQKGGAGELAPDQDQGAPGPDNNVGFNDKMTQELEGMRSARR